MTDEQILEKYKELCGNLKPADMMSFPDYKSLQDLEQFIADGKVKADDVIKAFKKANKSKFLTGQVKNFKADIRWMTNPVNIEKVNSGKYDDIQRSQASYKSRPQSHNYNFDKIEKEQHQKNMAKLEKIRKDKDHQEWLENKWYKKYPNMKGA